ncbi:MAG: hypothetical protein GX062_02670 [Firmicutes bacterium]|jgi:hypothetical protein|nr:hypothetical protein [Bacillota bacterium]
MNLLALPVGNGVFPRPGGSIQGMFLDDFSLLTLGRLGTNAPAFLVPLTSGGRALYPAGMMVQIEGLSQVQAVDASTWRKSTVMVARLRGLAHARARRFVVERRSIVAQGVEELNLAQLRERGQPVISGAGWQPLGGYTEPRSTKDISITIYGGDYEGNPVAIQGQVGGLVTAEQAHTLEHAIIRVLQECGVCTTKNLAWSVKAEAEELKESIQWGLQFRLPEILGQTSSGQCGNPMTNLAHFYLGQELARFLGEGRTLPAALERARSRTFSRLARDLDLGSQPEAFTLRSLKKGMLHDDSEPLQRTLRQVLQRFPLDPWS